METNELADKPGEPLPVKEPETQFKFEAPPEMPIASLIHAESLVSDSTPVAESKPSEPSLIDAGDLLGGDPAPGEVKGETVWTCPKCGKGPYQYRSFATRHINRAHRENAAEIVAMLPGATGERKAKTVIEKPPSAQPEQKADFKDLEETGKEMTVIDYGKAAGVTFDFTTNLLAATLGPEWMPRPPIEAGKPGERDMVVNALGVYMEAQGIPDIPPGMMLLCVCCIYAGPRLHAATPTRTKLRMAWLWLKTKLFRRK